MQLPRAYTKIGFDGRIVYRITGGLSPRLLIVCALVSMPVFFGVAMMTRPGNVQEALIAAVALALIFDMCVIMFYKGARALLRLLGIEITDHVFFCEICPNQIRIAIKDTAAAMPDRLNDIHINYDHDVPVERITTITIRNSSFAEQFDTGKRYAVEHPLTYKRQALGKRVLNAGDGASLRDYLTPFELDIETADAVYAIATGLDRATARRLVTDICRQAGLVPTLQTPAAGQRNPPETYNVKRMES